MKFSSFLFGSILLITVLVSCTGSTKELVSTTPTSSGIFPSWYSSNGFSSDSLAFYGYGVAIAADSTDAISRATIDAQNKLSTSLGKLAEDIRLDMERDNIAASKNADFILLLRNAHSDVSTFSESKNSYTSSHDNSYRAIVQISITKDQAHQMFKSGFNGHPRYWAAFSGTAAYQSSFSN
ncbi:MAG: hypothetical protein JJ895_00220 [Balneolaceae bacterium]|nr:hypothetical protein [Balneolaceae bacterium]